MQHLSCIHRNDAEANLWAGLTTAGYDGYLNIYDPSTNPTGVWRNPAPSNSWTADQKATNLALPVFPTLKNVTMGAMINFQLASGNTVLEYIITNIPKHFFRIQLKL